jgi:hypothetical protein
VLAAGSSVPPFHSPTSSGSAVGHAGWLSKLRRSFPNQTASAPRLPASAPGITKAQSEGAKRHHGAGKLRNPLKMRQSLAGHRAG